MPVEFDPDILNDEGFPTRLGSSRFAHVPHPLADGSMNRYCGRVLGEEVIPDSDRQCGPEAGPQCPSCRRMQRSRSPSIVWAVDGTEIITDATATEAEPAEDPTLQ